MVRAEGGREGMWQGDVERERGREEEEGRGGMKGIGRKERDSESREAEGW